MSKLINFKNAEDNTSTLKKSSKYRNDISKVSTYQYPFVDSRTLLDYNEIMKNNHTNLKQGNKISSLPNSQKAQSFASDISSILLESYPFSITFEEIDKNVHCNYLDIDSFNSSFSETKGLSSFHLNVCSLPKYHDNLSILLESIHHKFDIIGISETRLNDSNLPSHNININGYHCISTPTESTAGGTDLYIDDSLIFSDRKDLSTLLYSPKQLESSFVELSLKNQSNIIVACIYKHHSFSVIEFTNMISIIIDQINKEGKSLVFLGDFNVNLLGSEKNTNVANFIDTLCSHLILPANFFTNSDH